MDKMDINAVLMGKRIRAARRSKNITSDALAEQVNIAVESLWHIENGARKTSLTTLVKIAAVLDVSLDYLVGRSDSPINTVIAPCAEAHRLTEAQTKLLLELCESMIPVIRNMV